MGPAKLCIIILVFISGYQCDNHAFKIELEKIVEEVNSQKTTWTADISSIPQETINNFKHMVGTLKSEPQMKLDSYRRMAGNEKSLPKAFDARSQWANCTSIAHIYDQGNCGSCWAVSTTTAFNDRLCIASGGKMKTPRSVQQVLSCCHKCAGKSDGCKGGYLAETYRYLKRHGVVTGGDYNSSEGCQPYKFPKCDHIGNGGYYPACYATKPASSGKCKFRCSNKEYTTSFKKDIIKAKNIYSFESVKDAMVDIYDNGPITTVLEVYTDLFAYKKGIYQHVTGEFAGYHAVRVIGWGVDNKVPYWLIANSWNERWGDKGTFKIIRGKNHLSIEEEMDAALPSV